MKKISLEDVQFYKVRTQQIMDSLIGLYDELDQYEQEVVSKICEREGELQYCATCARPLERIKTQKHMVWKCQECQREGASKRSRAHYHKTKND